MDCEDFMNLMIVEPAQGQTTKVTGTDHQEKLVTQSPLPFLFQKDSIRMSTRLPRIIESFSEYWLNL